MFEHQTVLRDEAANALVWRTDGIYIDATFGRGGHSRAILERLAPRGQLIAFDCDPWAMAAAAHIEDKRFTCVHRSFAELGSEMSQRGIQKISGILLDLGVSSPQLEDPSRGFSFRVDGPLDMRMNPSQGQSAAQWLATVAPAELTRVIKTYGEERFAARIARAIIARREKSDRLGSLDGTRALANCVAQAVKTRSRHHHPATRTFQAIRIYINEELTALQAALAAVLALLEERARLVVISFHSLEDRIVKQFIKAHAQGPSAWPDLPEPERFSIETQRAASPKTVSGVLNNARLRLRDKLAADSKSALEHSALLKLLARVRASAAEVSANPRARSAIMRIAERVAVAASPL